MSQEDKYFTFPLTILGAKEDDTTPLNCLYLAVDCGCLNAGKGFLNRNDWDSFEESFDVACQHFDLEWASTPDPDSLAARYVLGAKICGVGLPQGCDTARCAQMAQDAEAPKMPFIRMAAKLVWAAIDQARYEADPTYEKPEHGLSWREFRVLAAILSWPETKEGFTSPGWESIQARANGFVTKDAFKKAERLADHLPKLSRRQIRDTLNTLEALNMFARFRLSTGKRGGRMFYSFRHSREELAEAVCRKTNFQDRARVRENREEDSLKCLRLLKRAKSGTSLEQVADNQGAK